jgi:arginase
VEPARQRNRFKDRATPVELVQIALCLGANRAGVEQGAAALVAALQRRLTSRGFDDVAQRIARMAEVRAPALEEAVPFPDEEALHVTAIARISREVADLVGAALQDGRAVLALGGDHSMAIGTLAAASRLGRLGVIWVDAHGDINTPATSPSRRVHGMPVAVALGYGPREIVAVGHQFDVQLDDLVYIGVRNLDPGERALLRQSPAQVYTMASIDRLSMAGVAAEAIDRLTERGVDAVHLSFDLDALDPSVITGIGSPEPGGLTYREADQLLTLLRNSDLPLVSADFAELDPTLDPSGQSVRLAAGLAARLLGEEIL